jgi:hypothetical protein
MKLRELLDKNDFWSQHNVSGSFVHWICVALEVDVIVFTSRMFIQCRSLFLHDQMFTADCTTRFLLQPQFEI